MLRFRKFNLQNLVVSKTIPTFVKSSKNHRNHGGTLLDSMLKTKC